MPIFTGDRLSRLQLLQRRTKHELDSALRRGETHDAKRLTVLNGRLLEAIDAATPKPARRAEHVLDRLTELGVTSNDVKVWAVSAGLLDAVRRGRVKASLVEAYAAAHPTTEKDFPA